MRLPIVLLSSATLLFCLGASPLFAQRGHSGGVLGGVQGSVQGVTNSTVGAQLPKGDGVRQGQSPMGQNNLGLRLQDNTQLASNLQSSLPAGTNLQNASTGFDSLGDFVAAVNVSHNLGIPFDQLKSKVTGENSVSLGKAIHELKPEMSSKEANGQAKEARKEADHQIKASGKTKANAQAQSQAGEQTEGSKTQSSTQAGARAGVQDEAAVNAGGASAHQQGQAGASVNAQSTTSKPAPKPSKPGDQN